MTSILLTLFTFIFTTNMALAEFFQDMSSIIKNNKERLSYGISVTDFNKDGQFEFVVTGFKHPNLALSYKKGYLEDVNVDEVFSDDIRSTIIKQVLSNNRPWILCIRPWMCSWWMDSSCCQVSWKSRKSYGS